MTAGAGKHVCIQLIVTRLNSMFTDRNLNKLPWKTCNFKAAGRVWSFCFTKNFFCFRKQKKVFKSLGNICDFRDKKMKISRIDKENEGGN